MQTSTLTGRISTFFNSEHTSGVSGSSSFANKTSSMKMKNTRRFMRNSKFLPFILIGVIVVGIIFFTVRSVAGNSRVASPLGSEDSQVEIKKPRASQSLQRQFLFPLKDQTGKEVSKLKLNIQSIELRDEIIVKGQRARSVRGRTFLIVNLKIENDFDKSLQINSRDYFRLSVNNSNEKLAPEIHNDPVEVQAISTKYTRIGFPINEDDTNLSLQVGEIKGKKEVLKLNLR